MSTLGSFAKGLAFVLGKQPEDEDRPRGFLGLEWVEQVEAGRTEIAVARVLKGSPAATAGLETGDRIEKINRRLVVGLKAAREALRVAEPGDTVTMVVHRGKSPNDRALDLTLVAGDGL